MQKLFGVQSRRKEMEETGSRTGWDRKGAEGGDKHRNQGVPPGDRDTSLGDASGVSAICHVLTEPHFLQGRGWPPSTDLDQPVMARLLCFHGVPDGRHRSAGKTEAGPQQHVPSLSGDGKWPDLQGAP